MRRRILSNDDGSEILYTTTDGTPISINSYWEKEYPIISNAWDNDKECFILKFKKVLTKLPSVTGASATNAFFYNQTNLQSIIIPEGIETLGSNVFYNCSSLIEITFPTTLKRTTDQSLRGSSIKRVNICDLEAYCNIDFDDNMGYPFTGGLGDIYLNDEILETVTIPKTFTVIKPNVFRNSSIHEVILHDEVNEIGNYSFYNCSNLQKIKLNNVTKIGNDSFYRCSILSDIGNLGNCNSVGGYAFYYCQNIYGDINLGNCNSIGGSAFHYCGKITSVEMPNVVTVGGSAFNNCAELETVKMEKCNSINTTAFGSCKKLKDIGTNLNLCKTIGSNAFGGCVELELEADLSNCTTIDKAAFWNCKKLTSVKLSPNLTKIGGGAFYGCTNIEKVFITNLKSYCNITTESYTIGTTKSYEYESLPLYKSENLSAELYLNDVLVEDITDEMLSGASAIKPYVFYNYRYIKSLSIPSSVKTIGGHAFYKSTVTHIDIKATNNLTIENNAFGYLGENITVNIDSLESWLNITRNLITDFTLYVNNIPLESDFTLPNKFTNIPKYAFANIKNFENVTLHTDIETIGESAFDCCRNMNSIDLSMCNNLKVLEKNILNRCVLLEYVVLPSSLVKINNSFNTDAGGHHSVIHINFENLINLEDISLSCRININLIDLSNSTKITTIGGFYNLNTYKTNNELEIILPKSVTTVNSYFLNGSYGLTKLTTPVFNIDSGSNCIKTLQELTLNGDELQTNILTRLGTAMNENLKIFVKPELLEDYKAYYPDIYDRFYVI